MSITIRIPVLPNLPKVFRDIYAILKPIAEKADADLAAANGRIAELEAQLAGYYPRTGGDETPQQCYINARGVVGVPDDIRERLGLVGGGGVVFLENRTTGHVEMLSNDQFLALIEPRENQTTDPDSSTG